MMNQKILFLSYLFDGTMVSPNLFMYNYDPGEPQLMIKRTDSLKMKTQHHTHINIESHK